MAEKSPLTNGPNGHGWFRVNWQTVLGWVVTALLAYGAVEARVRVLEFQFSTLANDLREVKADVKTLLYGQRGQP